MLLCLAFLLHLEDGAHVIVAVIFISDHSLLLGEDAKEQFRILSDPPTGGRALRLYLLDMFPLGAGLLIDSSSLFGNDLLSLLHGLILSSGLSLLRASRRRLLLLHQHPALANRLFMPRLPIRTGCLLQMNHKIIHALIRGPLLQGCFLQPVDESLALFVGALKKRGIVIPLADTSTAHNLLELFNAVALLLVVQLVCAHGFQLANSIDGVFKVQVAGLTGLLVLLSDFPIFLQFCLASFTGCLHLAQSLDISPLALLHNLALDLLIHVISIDGMGINFMFESLVVFLLTARIDRIEIGNIQ